MTLWCCYYLNLRYAVIFIGIFMASFFTSTPWIPRGAVWIDEGKFQKYPNLDLKDYSVCFFGCIMCSVLAIGASHKNLWVTLAGYVGYIFALLAMTILVWIRKYHNSFSLFDLKENSLFATAFYLVQANFVSIIYFYLDLSYRQTRVTVRPLPTVIFTNQ